MVWRTVPICDPCWVDQEGSRSPVRVITHGNPLREVCYFCHAPTRGVYIRAQVTQEAMTPDDAA